MKKRTVEVIEYEVGDIITVGEDMIVRGERAVVLDVTKKDGKRLYHIWTNKGDHGQFNESLPKQADYICSIDLSLLFDEKSFENSAK